MGRTIFPKVPWTEGKCRRDAPPQNLRQKGFCREMEENKKQDGFKNEEYIVIPTESFSPLAQHPLVQGLYLTDVGFFPHALHHYRERKEGADEYILIYCTEGEGYIHVGGKVHTIRSQEAFCIPIHERHRYYASQTDPWSILWVHFKGENVKYFPLDRQMAVRVDSQAADNRIMTLFRILFRVLRRNYTQGNFIYISQVLSLILSEIYFREKGEGTEKQVVQPPGSASAGSGAVSDRCGFFSTRPSSLPGEKRGGGRVYPDLLYGGRGVYPCGRKGTHHPQPGGVLYSHT